MKLTRRFMVFLTGFACLVFVSAQPGTVKEASAKIAFPTRAVAGPYGFISDLFYLENGIGQAVNGLNQVEYVNLANIETQATCNIGVTMGYSKNVTFVSEWSLTAAVGGNFDKHLWNETLSPGSTANRNKSVSKNTASGVWHSKVEITYSISNGGSGTLDSEIVTFVGFN